MPTNPWPLRILWTLRSLVPLFRWLDRVFWSGENAAARRFKTDWDYRQADLQNYDAEPDFEALVQALTLRDSDPVRAFAELRALALRQSPRALNIVGEAFYWGGLSVRQDKAAGELWFKRAFEQGSLRGMLNYGKALSWRGEFQRSAEVFAVGADANWAPALDWLARARVACSRSAETLNQARQLWERSMKLGSPAAKSALGALMSVGVFGLSQVSDGFQLVHEASLTPEAKEPPPRTTLSGDTLH